MGGGEFVVENQDIGFERLREGGDFGGLAGADEMARVDFAVLNEFAADNGDAERFDELGQFFEEALGFPALLGADVGSDEQGALDHFRLFPNFEHRTVSAGFFPGACRSFSPGGARRFAG